MYVRRGIYLPHVRARFPWVISANAGENTLCSKRSSLAWTNVSRLHVHLVLHVLRSWIERACRFIASTNLFFDCAIVRFLGLRTPFEGKTGQRAKKRCRFNRFLCLRVPLFFLLRGRGEEGLTSLRERLNIGNWNVSGISKFTQFFLAMNFEQVYLWMNSRILILCTVSFVSFYISCNLIFFCVNSARRDSINLDLIFLYVWENKIDFFINLFMKMYHIDSLHVNQ